MLKQKFLLGEMALFLICFSGLENPYVQLLVLNFFSDFDLQKLIFGNFEEFSLFFEVF